MKIHKIWTVTVDDWSQKFLHNPSWAAIELALSGDPELQVAVRMGKVAVHFSSEDILVNTPLEGVLDPKDENSLVWDR